MQPLYLLDTNIISELNAPHPNQNVIEKLVEYKTMSCTCSVVFDELLYGAKRLKAGKRRTDLMHFYIDYLQTAFDIIPFDYHASWINSDLSERLEAIGKPAPRMDSMIAATAIANNLVLVTRNTKDFEAIQEVSPLMVENWFMKGGTTSAS